jgi:CubicO group peptidase (beta-lactamase class C family)
VQRRSGLIWAAAAWAASGAPWGRALAAPPAGTPDGTADGASAARRRAFAQVIEEAAAQAPLTHAVLVEQHGRLLAEAYFTAEDKPSGDWIARSVAFDAGTLHDMRSISKSVVALLVGIAHGQGKLDTERPVMDWFPEHAALATPKRQAMRLQHLLTMTTGLEWNETAVSYANLNNSETRMGLSLDPVAYELSREIVAEPGRRFEYSGGATLLLAEILERATGRPIDAYAREVLFLPLGIENFAWRHHILWGKPLPFSGLRLTPCSMIVVGRLVFGQGRAGRAQGGERRLGGAVAAAACRRNRPGPGLWLAMVGGAYRARPGGRRALVRRARQRRAGADGGA